MDTSDPEITFDSDGICNHCRQAVEALARVRKNSGSTEKLDATLAEIKRRGRGCRYDCVVGLSGGVDSTYIAYSAKKAGLRCLAVHFDSGWNSELAVKNIEQTVKLLDIDLYTFVCNWDEMRDLQLAFFKASVPNCDIPQDHAIVAALFKVASRLGIKTILTGNNVVSESILPRRWVYNYLDLFHLKSLQRRFGNGALRAYPRLGFFRYYFYYPYIRRIQTVRFLNLISFSKAKAMEVLQSELGWKYYGGKHYESVFTRYFQGYYLPLKYGYDKRRAHLSSLIVAGEVTREAALAEMSKSDYIDSRLAREDHVFVAKKLGLSPEALSTLIAAKPLDHSDYPTMLWVSSVKDLIKRKLGIQPRV